MITIKLTTPWQHNYAQQTLSTSKYRLEINTSCTEADFWFIWGGLTQAETVKCPKENIIYITDEAHEMRLYNQAFLDQFEHLWAVRSDLHHKHISTIHEPLIWYFNKSRAELENMKTVAKLHDLSVVASDLTSLDGHKRRFAFVNKMIGHFKDSLHVYGRGFNSVDDKWRAIAPYKYSIAIENNVIPHYFTEKLTECFLSYTMPIYFGCPNIKEYFDERAMILIDINDYKASIETIERAIHENWYDARLKYITEARTKVLNEYHVFAQIGNFVNGYTSGKYESTLNTILPEKQFVMSEAEVAELNRLSLRGVKLPLKILLQALRNKWKI